MPKREVEKIAAEHLRPLNQGLVTVGSATKFEDHVQQVYTQADLKVMATSTQERLDMATFTPARRCLEWSVSEKS
jgi:hypothetical protein